MSESKTDFVNQTYQQLINQPKSDRATLPKTFQNIDGSNVILNILQLLRHKFNKYTAEFVKLEEKQKDELKRFLQKNTKKAKAEKQRSKLDLPTPALNVTALSEARKNGQEVIALRQRMAVLDALIKTIHRKMIYIRDNPQSYANQIEKARDDISKFSQTPSLKKYIDDMWQQFQKTPNEKPSDVTTSADNPDGQTQDSPVTLMFHPRDLERYQNIMLMGDAGTGKSEFAVQVAKFLSVLCVIVDPETRAPMMPVKKDTKVGSNKGEHVFWEGPEHCSPDQFAKHLSTIKVEKYDSAFLKLMGYSDRDDPPSPSSSPCTFGGKRFTMGGKNSSPFEEFFVTPYTSSDLIAAYIGQSGPKTQALLTRHVEKVLFIDEAYTIGEQGSFSDEIMPILLTFAEKNQGGSVIIMAGYANRMQEFFRLNEGLKRRIPHQLVLKNVDAEGAWAALKTLLNFEGYTYKSWFTHCYGAITTALLPKEKPFPWPKGMDVEWAKDVQKIHSIFGQGYASLQLIASNVKFWQKVFDDSAAPAPPDILLILSLLDSTYPYNMRDSFVSPLLLAEHRLILLSLYETVLENSEPSKALIEWAEKAQQLGLLQIQEMNRLKSVLMRQKVQAAAPTPPPNPDTMWQEIVELAKQKNIFISPRLNADSVKVLYDNVKKYKRSKK